MTETQQGYKVELSKLNRRWIPGLLGQLGFPFQRVANLTLLRIISEMRKHMVLMGVCVPGTTVHITKSSRLSGATEDLPKFKILGPEQGLKSIFKANQWNK